MSRQIIVGAGNFGREVACWIMGHNPTKRLDVAFIDDTDANPEGIYSPRYPPKIGTIAGYRPVPGDIMLLAISDPAARKRIHGLLKSRDALFAGMLSPDAVCACTSMMGDGMILCPFSLLSAGCRVGEFCIVNTFSSIGHDVKLGPYCTLSSHVDLCGGVEAGEGVFFGSGASVMPGVKIGDYAKIGAGAVVMRDVPPGVTMVGNPAVRLVRNSM